MVILYILLALMLALIAVLTFNTVKATKKARKLTEFKPFYNDDEIKYYVTFMQDLAKYIAEKNDCPLVLGSATPDLKTFYLTTEDGENKIERFDLDFYLKQKNYSVASAISALETTNEIQKSYFKNELLIGIGEEFICVGVF